MINPVAPNPLPLKRPKTGRRYYNPLDYQPFEMCHLDRKDVIDCDTLPKEVYYHFLNLKKKGLPFYQFSTLDIRSRLG